MARLKVLHLSSERSWRGGEQQIAYLIDHLVSQGVDVAVAARRGSAFAKWCASQNIPCTEMDFANGFDVRTALGIKRLGNSFNADIVHVHSGKAHSLAYLASRLGMKQPIVVHRRVDFELSSSALKLRKFNATAVVRILCVSNAIANIVKPRLQNPDKVSTVYDGVDFERFDRFGKTGYLHQALGIDPSKMLVANISALAPHKDYPTYIETAAKTLQTRDDVHFLAVGAGDQGPKLKELVRKLAIEAHFTFTDFRDDIPHLLQEVDVFMMTSKTEGLGSSIIDAMYSRLPVVATRAGGIPELVVDGATGLLFDSGDVEGLHSGLNRLLDDEALRKEMGAKGAERSMLFSKAHMAESVLQTYKQILHEV